MKTNFRKATIAGVMSLVAFGALSASAMGFGGMKSLTPEELATKHSTMFQEQATLLQKKKELPKNSLKLK